MNLPFMTTGGLPEDSAANALSQSVADITPDAAKMDEIAPKVIEAMKTVYDPEIPSDIYELGLIYKIDIADDLHVVELRLGRDLAAMSDRERSILRRTKLAVVFPNAGAHDQSTLYLRTRRVG